MTVELTEIETLTARPTLADPHHPVARAELGDEPPAGVTVELLWRVAARLHRDHATAIDQKAAADDPDAVRRRCRQCRQPWPCSGFRLAELALISANG